MYTEKEEVNSDRAIRQTKITNEFGGFFISTCNTPDHGRETMVFLIDKKGRVVNWLDLDCNRYDNDHEALQGHIKMLDKWRKTITMLTDCTEFINDYVKLMNLGE